MLSTILTIKDIQIKASFFLNFFKLDMLKNTSLKVRKLLKNIRECDNTHFINKEKKINIFNVLYLSFITPNYSCINFSFCLANFFLDTFFFSASSLGTLATNFCFSARITSIIMLQFYAILNQIKKNLIQLTVNTTVGSVSTSPQTRSTIQHFSRAVTRTPQTSLASDPESCPTFIISYLSTTTNTAIEPSERYTFFLVFNILQVLYGTTERHLLDSLSCLSRVLRQKKTNVLQGNYGELT
ncbi:hypothetical protein AGLY_008479 [Aphis glycines]|uniref:Uncharacterized protein n=1 Tax=Aphis glycines TaxID=307491 RepID=A0A6G0TMD2_APHGL|nr:hypothetical protein AGLY_008479 [Aphis glycines]